MAECRTFLRQCTPKEEDDGFDVPVAWRRSGVRVALFAEQTEHDPMTTDPFPHTYLGSLVADAVSMPVHWYYDREALRAE
jgi:hypothetical protein